MSLDADRHIVIATATATFLPSGAKLTGPVDSVDKLEKLLLWVRSRGGLQPRANTATAGEGLADPAQLWLIGAAARHLLSAQPTSAHTLEEITERLGQALGALVGRGWKISGSGPGRVLLAHPEPAPVNVEILIAEAPWLLPETNLDLDSAEAAATMGERIIQWSLELEELPSLTPGGSAAGVLAQIMRARTPAAGGRKTPAAVVTTPGWLPDDVLPETRIQPPWAPTAESVERAFDQAVDLAWMDQESPLLASAGMITLGYGQPVILSGAAATEQARLDKPPFGLWLAELPALNLPDGLPPIHPAITAPPVPAQICITTQDLAGFTKEIRDGGAGLSLEQITITAALIWPQQARLLEAWAKRFRQARSTFAARPAMLALIDTASTEFLNQLATPTSSTPAAEAALRYHPAWAAALTAHTRQRVRRTALRIAREFHVWPIYLHDTAAVYALPQDSGTGHGLDIADTHTRLGRLTEQRRAPIDDQTILAAIVTETPHELAATLAAALEIDAPAPSSIPTATSATEPATNGAAPKDPAPQADPQEPKSARPRRAAANRKPPTEKSAARDTKLPGGIPAAVLHTDGLWMPGGAKIELPEPIVHAGQVAELAYAHNIGYQLSESYSEAPQIWITTEACKTFGIAVEAISTRTRDRAKSLHQLTEGLDFLTLAAAQGWAFGGAKADEEPRLGPWTRVYRHRDSRPGVMLALIPGMDTDEREMPILANEPTPAQIATRLQRLADVLKFPWKINAGVTAVDLMLQARPKTWTPKDWRNMVWGPSTTPVPYALDDIERDFNWSRTPGEDELNLKYVHAYDRGGSYVAGIAGTELPIGDPEHHEGGIPFDPKLPGYWLIDIPEPGDWRFPYLLNPGRYDISEPRWVTTPRLERAIALGYNPEILEAVVWPQHGRVLLGWYERLRDAQTSLDTDDTDDRAARSQAKVIRTHGIGIIGSAEYLKGKTGYDPAKRFHVMAKANANIIYRIHQIGQDTGRWPLAVITDTVLYASDDPNPDTAWPGKPAQYGRNFGQYKPERSGFLVDQLKYLTGGDYKGKAHLTEVDQWRLDRPEGK